MAKVKAQCLKNNHHISGQLLLSDELNEVEFFMTTIYNKYLVIPLSYITANQPDTAVWKRLGQTNYFFMPILIIRQATYNKRNQTWSNFHRGGKVFSPR